MDDRRSLRLLVDFFFLFELGWVIRMPNLSTGTDPVSMAIAVVVGEGSPLLWIEADCVATMGWTPSLESESKSCRVGMDDRRSRRLLLFFVPLPLVLGRIGIPYSSTATEDDDDSSGISYSG